jgi:hypothetical protein
LEWEAEAKEAIPLALDPMEMGELVAATAEAMVEMPEHRPAAAAVVEVAVGPVCFLGTHLCWWPVAEPAVAAATREQPTT